jgi:mRNA interferase MazF
LKRGDVVIATASGMFGGKPRPYVVVQADELATPLLILVGCTDADGTSFSFRPHVTPSPRNGLAKDSVVMVDIPVTTYRDKVRQVIGHLEPTDLSAVDAALIRVLGLTGIA